MQRTFTKMQSPLAGLIANATHIYENAIPVSRAYCQCNALLRKCNPRWPGLLPMQRTFTKMQSPLAGLLPMQRAFPKMQSPLAGLLPMQRTFPKMQSPLAGLIANATHIYENAIPVSRAYCQCNAHLRKCNPR